MQREPGREHLPGAEVGHTLLTGFAAGALGDYLLFPGDPDRVELMASQWDRGEVHQLPRGYKAATGFYRGAPIAAVSHGIGAPSLEYVLHEVAALGVKTVIRVGSTGSLHADIGCGDLVVNEASMRLDGTTDAYVPPGYPAVASHEVTAALLEAARGLGYRVHCGIGATAASFFLGQGRPAFGGFETARSRGLLNELRQARVLNLEMEAAALFTLCRLFGLRSGAVLAVVANRVTGEWRIAGEEEACRTAAEAVVLLRSREGAGA
jgi:uridine phosphorylase